MNNTTLPIYTLSQEPSARKISHQNFADLLAALENMMNSRGDTTMSNDLMAILTSMYDQLSGSLNHDPTGTIKHMKLLSTYFLSYIRGSRPFRGDFTVRQWDLTHDCPVLLVEFITWYNQYNTNKTGFVNNDFWFLLQITYAFLNGHRVIVTPMSVNLNTIVAPSRIKDLPNFKDQWLPALDAIGVTPKEFQAVYKSMCSKAKFSIITSGGPNGQATWSADLDAKAIMADPDLFLSMFNFAKESNLDRIVTNLVGTAPTPLQMNPGHRENVFTGRIHALEEWGGKTRLVAILDYWTQTLLTPLHDTINYFLRRLEQDGTFNQEKIADRVKAWTGDVSLSVNSYDLTAATDRIPIDLQVDMLTALFGSDKLPKLWKAILVGRTYFGPRGESVRYAVGQPMGAKSSFPMLALIHHAIIQISAIQASVPKYTKYVVLGDDNSHADSKVASKYLAIMDSIGVDISMHKSVLSSDHLLPAAEICKRVFVKGLELTSIPVKALVKTVRRGHLASTLQSLLHTRGDPLPKADLVPFFAGLLDKRSLQSILLLNRMPSSVTGIVDPIDVSAIEALDYSKWFDNIQPTEKDIEHAYIFALVSEQLKRIDGLLRSTMLMSETIKTMARPDPQKMWPVQLFENLPEAERAKALSSLPQLNWSHPIVHASLSEVERVTSHLTALRAGTKVMQDKARNGLLDLLRNNLSEIWMGEAEKSATVRRSIFNAMLSVLKRMDSAKVPEGKNRSIEFSLELIYIQRSWSVYWEFGSAPRINAVKTRVSVSKTLNSNKTLKVFDDVKLRDFRV